MSVQRERSQSVCLKVVTLVLYCFSGIVENSLLENLQFAKKNITFNAFSISSLYQNKKHLDFNVFNELNNNVNIHIYNILFMKILNIIK